MIQRFMILIDDFVTSLNEVIQLYQSSVYLQFID